jgi:hypothetical protein
LTHGAVLNCRFKLKNGLAFFGDVASSKTAVIGVIVVLGTTIAGTLCWQAFRAARRRPPAKP